MVAELDVENYCKIISIQNSIRGTQKLKLIKERENSVQYYTKTSYFTSPKAFPNSINCSFNRSLLNFSLSAFWTFLAVTKSLNSPSDLLLLINKIYPNHSKNNWGGSIRKKNQEFIQPTMQISVYTT